MLRLTAAEDVVSCSLVLGGSLVLQRSVFGVQMDVFCGSRGVF